MKIQLSIILYFIFVLIFIIQVQVLGWFLGDNNINLEKLEKINFLGINVGYENFKFLGILGILLFIATLIMIAISLINFSRYLISKNQNK